MPVAGRIATTRGRAAGCPERSAFEMTNETKRRKE